MACGDLRTGTLNISNRLFLKLIQQIDNIGIFALLVYFFLVAIDKRIGDFLSWSIEACERTDDDNIIEFIDLTHA